MSAPSKGRERYGRGKAAPGWGVLRWSGPWAGPPPSDCGAPMTPMLPGPFTDVRRHRALVVSEDPLGGRTVQRLLARLGHDPLWVRSPHEALGHLDDPGGGWGLVIVELDALVPGLEALASAVQRRPGALGMLVVSGRLDTADLTGPLRDQPLLRKPFELIELAAELRRMGRRG